MTAVAGDARYQVLGQLATGVYARQTTQGKIEVDTATHAGRYVPRL